MSARFSNTLICALVLTSAVAAQSVIHNISEPGSFRLGTDVACAGDVDADGFDDVVVGDGYAGAVYVYSGASGARIRTLVAPGAATPPGGGLPGQPGSSGYGFAVDGAGDVNGDGHDDVIAGAGPVLNAAPGEVTIFSGLDGSALHVISDPSTLPSFFGLAVAGIGDVDGDGLPDVAIGASLRSTNGLANNGGVDVYSGNGALLFSVAGTHTSARLGESVARTGDVDGDGLADFIAGRRGPNGLDGEAVVYSGAGGAVISVHAPSSPSLFLFAVGNLNPAAVVGTSADFDADGIDDYVLGRPFDAAGGPHAGAVFVFSGADGSVLANHPGRPCDRLGVHTGLGDVSGDGKADIVAGKANDLGLLDEVSVFSGATGAMMFATSGLAGDATQGAIAGDVNGDGYLDVVVGSDPLGPHASQVTVIGGGPALGPAAVPTLGSGAGDVLTVDGDTGGEVRRVDRGLGAAFSLQLAQPSSNPTPARHIVFGGLGTPPEDFAFPVPGIGDLAVTPWAAQPTAPWLFVLADSFGVFPALVQTLPGGFSLPSPGGLPIPLDITLQGVIEETPGAFRTTNAIILSVR